MTNPLRLADRCISLADRCISLADLAIRQHDLLTEAQLLLAKHIQPGGFSKRDVIDRLLRLLDSPEAIVARDDYEAVILKGAKE